jgi:hypothetical protein
LCASIRPQPPAGDPGRNVRLLATAYSFLHIGTASCRSDPSVTSCHSFG